MKSSRQSSHPVPASGSSNDPSSDSMGGNHQQNVVGGDAAGSACPSVELNELLREFYGGPAGFSQLAEFESRTEVPEPYDRLLDHHEHMTVTVESFHRESVEVEVHQSHVRDGWYSREITLKGANSGHVVQYGIVRLHIDSLAPEVWRRIESRSTPLGRVLIEHDVMREVHLCGLWKAQAGPCLANHLRTKIGAILFGRTALIYCDGEPAIQLLEIVSEV